MDTYSSLTEETFTYIIENTIKECNRALQNWKENEKVIRYDDKVSLFRSYLSKYFKHKFGFSAYIRYIRPYHPLITIHNYRVVGIDFNIPIVGAPNVYLGSLQNCVNNMDVMKFSELWENRSMYYSVLPVEETVEISKLVDYSKIENIKF